MSSKLEVIQDYIRRETGYEEALDPDADLLDEGILDSFTVVQVAMFVQDEFDIELEAEDLVRENLATLSSIISLIESKAGGTA